MANSNSLQLAEQQVNSRGAKFCPLSDTGGERVHWTFGSRADLLSTQWGPSQFDPNAGTSRCNMDFICDTQMAKELSVFDAWARGYIEKNSQRLFNGKTLTESQVVDGYKPTLIERGAYPSQVKCKINLSGPRAVRCWDENGSPRDPPENWRACKFVAKVNASHLWLMSKEMGFVLNITDLQIFEESRVCPFV